MRTFLLAMGAVAALGANGLGLGPNPGGLGPAVASAQSLPRPLQLLQGALAQRAGQAGGRPGAYVVDLSTGQPLFSLAADTPRQPASVQKLFTTSTALLRFGPTATLSTSLLGLGTMGPNGAWSGTLYLRGGGDPTFGSAAFDRSNYGTGATIQRLVSAFVARSGIRSVSGQIIGDESYFDSLRGTPASGFSYSFWVEGSLSALVYNRGLLAGGGHVTRPALYAAQQLAATLRAAHVRVPAKTVRVAAGTTPATAQPLATVASPPVSTLVTLTNTPSDNFFAEMLLKGLGATFGGRGSTSAGAAVVRAELASEFGIAPAFNDGSGLSRADFTTPRQVVTLLSDMAQNPAFVASLAVAGETGTLQHEMRGTTAEGRCRAKTGTLSDVASLAGYCRAVDGHTLAFAFLMNGLGDSGYGHTVEANMAVALSKYDG